MPILQIERPFGRIRLVSLAVLGLVAYALSAAPASAQSVVAVVNGQPILSSEVAARVALQKLSGGKADKSAKDELIEEKLKVAEAKRYGFVATDAQVEAAFASIAQRVKLTPEMFSKAIAQRGVSAQTLKDRIRAEIGWAQLIRRKYQAQFASRDVTAAIASRGTVSNKATQFTLRQVVFVVPKGAPEAQFAQRRKEAIGAQGRFPGCDGAVAFAGQLRDVAAKEPVTRSSGQLGKEMTDMLTKVKIGGLTDPQRSDQGWEMIAVCERRDVNDDNSMKQQLMEEVGVKESQAQSEKYIAQLRSRAVIELR